VDALGFLVGEVVVNLERWAFRQHRTVVRVAGREQKSSIVQSEPCACILANCTRERRIETKNIGAYEYHLLAGRVLECERSHPQLRLHAFCFLVLVVGKQIAGFVGRDLHFRGAGAELGGFLRHGRCARRQDKEQTES
jgi:hypothetical protein